MSEGFAVWWLSQDDYLFNNKLFKFKRRYWPSYLHNEFRNGDGRYGRGRLWAAKGMPTSLSLAGVKRMVEFEKQHGPFHPKGIVIHLSDVKKVERLPGFLTDLEFKALP